MCKLSFIITIWFIDVFTILITLHVCGLGILCSKLIFFLCVWSSFMSFMVWVNFYLLVFLAISNLFCQCYCCRCFFQCSCPLKCQNMMLVRHCFAYLCVLIWFWCRISLPCYVCYLFFVRVIIMMHFVWN